MRKRAGLDSEKGGGSTASDGGFVAQGCPVVASVAPLN